MKRLLVIIASMAIVFGDTPAGQWKLSGLRVDYFDIARAETNVYASDIYGAGIVIPLFLDKLRVDPALASAVILSTITDVFGFLSFLGLATLFLI